MSFLPHKKFTWADIFGGGYKYRYTPVATPLVITSFHPMHETRREHGMVVLDNPLGLESKKIVD